jgi:transcriptional regulator with XRE-family HTH domain
VARNERLAAVIAKVLLQAREAAGLTQEQLAARARMDRSYISDIERGGASLSVDKLIRICRALDIRASRIMDQIEAGLPSSARDRLT